MRLHYMHPGGLLCFFFFEGMILLAVLLALAELVTWWVVIILPVSVATMVKINDVVAGLSFTQRGKAVLPRRIPAVARGSAAVGPTGSAPPQTNRLTTGRAVGRAVGTAPAPGSSAPGSSAPGRAPSPDAGTSGHPDPNPASPGTSQPTNGARPGDPAGPRTTNGARPGDPAGAGTPDGHGPADAETNADSASDPGAGPLPRRTAWPNQRRFERPV
ncbi:hypothetical protein Raf01_81530 [Rugosimonospora africana]|uniref:Uncharacterized protein n=1 Tax=Rugosimonospora africana TaxID=556532 RepID=A0A8J3R0J3_9ACTN|nr:hypothetical protein Raf01_81530 [Rugosimonospora africana]